MRQINFYVILLCVFCVACSGADTEPDEESIAGRWLVLYPDHHLRTKSERDVYGKNQDSIVNLFGLKLLMFSADGEFTELDSLFKAPGKWLLANKSQLQIREGGKGFNPFAATIEGLKNDTLLLTQFLPLQNEKIKVVWHLKKVEDDTLAQKLFLPEANAWRKKPTSPETELQIRQRLVSLLNFYNSYLKLVSKESSYFLIPRVHLPFRYFQHAIGMREQMPDGFVQLFYSEEDAKKAYLILGETVSQLANQFKWDENFVVEYALFFKRMTYRIQPKY